MARRKYPHLEQKLNALRRKVATARALIAFLKRHPLVGSQTRMWHSGSVPGLYFDEKAFIKPAVVDGRIELRLERYVQPGSDPEEWDTAKRTVCDDVSDMSRRKLDEVLKKVKVDLDDPDTYEED